jgi:16S rRNA (cytosine1402-N4)-methyltransferase
MTYRHIPVLLNEVLEGLSIKTGTYIDCTLGGGGYTFAIAKKLKDKGKVIAIDADEMAIKNAQKIIKEERIDNVILVHNNFRDLAEIALEQADNKVSGIVFDLGLSSAQLEDDNRGFSFQSNRPLDMAFGISSKRSTVSLLKTASVPELTRIFREYGEEPRAYRLAKAIDATRKEKKIQSTGDLLDIINKNLPARTRNEKVHPATKIFQALRMATNDEISSLETALKAIPDILVKGGKMAVVSFHSGEDRVVKNYLRQESKDCICPPSVPLCVCNHQANFKILNKKPIMASAEEIDGNPRSRSAKLRLAEKI